MHTIPELLVARRATRIGAGWFPVWFESELATERHPNLVLPFTGLENRHSAASTITTDSVSVQRRYLAPDDRVSERFRRSLRPPNAVLRSMSTILVMPTFQRTRVGDLSVGTWAMTSGDVPATQLRVGRPSGLWYPVSDAKVADAAGARSLLALRSPLERSSPQQNS